MGADVHYSGTVSAAFEGVILGVPAMAVSLGVGEGLSFHLAAKFACEVSEWILEHGLPRNTLLNINVPVGTPLGVKLTRLGVRRYTEGVVEERDPRGRRIYWIGGHEANSGFVSVTPLHLDMTDRRSLEKFRERKPSWLDSMDRSERE